MSQLLKLVLLSFAVAALAGCGGKSHPSNTSDASAQTDATTQAEVIVPSCVTECGGTKCGSAKCYACGPANTCVDISSSLWDQGIFGESFWGP